MGRVRFRGWEKVKTKFSDRNVVPGSTKYVDPGTCLTWQNHGDRTCPYAFFYRALAPNAHAYPPYFYSLLHFDILLVIFL